MEKHRKINQNENGFYNYRYEPFDQQKNPSVNAFFTDSKQKLYYYKGNVWYRKKIDAPSANTLLQAITRQYSCGSLTDDKVIKKPFCSCIGDEHQWFN